MIIYEVYAVLYANDNTNNAALPWAILRLDDAPEDWVDDVSFFNTFAKAKEELTYRLESCQEEIQAAFRRLTTEENYFGD